MTPPVSERATASDDLQSFGVESGRFPHPFTKGTDWDHYEGAKDDPERDTPRTLVELRMCALCAAIREKVDWHVKFRDEKIRSKWIEEIREQQKDLHESLQLTDNMVRQTVLVSLLNAHVRVDQLCLDRARGIC